MEGNSHDVEVIIQFGGFIGVILTLIAFAWKAGNWQRGIGDQLKEIDKDLKDVTGEVKNVKSENQAAHGAIQNSCASDAQKVGRLEGRVDTLESFVFRVLDKMGINKNGR